MHTSNAREAPTGCWADMSCERREASFGKGKLWRMSGRREVARSEELWASVQKDKEHMGKEVAELREAAESETDGQLGARQTKIK